MAPVYVSGDQYVTVGPGVGGEVSGGGGGIGSWLFGLFYQRYADSHTEAITYTGPGQGNIESRLVEVGAGQGQLHEAQDTNLQLQATLLRHLLRFLWSSADLTPLAHDL